MSTPAKRLTEEGLIPLHHLWYETPRVIGAICAALDRDAAEVGFRLDQHNESMSRRWREMVSGRQRWIRLPHLDALLCALDLHLAVDVGDPDVHATQVPTVLQRRGLALNPPPASELLAAA